MTMTIGLLIALILPLASAIMSIRTGNFYYNVGVTGGCIVLLALSPAPMLMIPIIACFIISIVGDYFMGHQQSSSQFYLYGIISFFLAHVCLVWYSFPQVDFTQVYILVLGAVLAIGYGVYLAVRILPHVNGTAMRVAICAYASISVLTLMMAVGLQVGVLQRVLYALGVLSIVVSDTFIAECDFAGNEKPGQWIMPTYFLCHLLITASALVSQL